MLSQLKAWCVNKCWDAFSMDSWKKKSQWAFTFLIITFIIAVCALIGVILAYVDIHVWSKANQSAVILVPKEKFIEIHGQLYIPIKVI